MRIRPSDAGWLAVSAFFAGLAVYYIVTIVRLFITGVTVDQAVGGILVGIAVLAGGRWLVLGAWRRTVWGAPPGGNRHAREIRDRAPVSGGSRAARGPLTHRQAWDLHAGRSFDPDELTAEGSLAAAWRRVFAERAGEAAITGRAGEVRYGDLDAWTRRLASGLLQAGLAPGDRVAMYTTTSLAQIICHVATLRAGGVVVPCNPDYREPELTHICRDAGVGWAVAGDATRAELLRTAAPGAQLIALTEHLPGADHTYPELVKSPETHELDAARGEDPAIISYTSGTTGAPKGAVLRHRNLLAGARAVMAAWRWNPADRLLLALPLFHMHGLGVGLHGTLTSGASAHVLAGFEPGEVLAEIERSRATLLFGVPTMYHRLVEHADRRADVSSLRLCVSGSAPLPEALFSRISERFGHPPLERYGMTETVMNISNPYEGERRPGSIGLPLPGVEVRLVGPAGEARAGEEGEIWLRGPNVFDGYLNRPEETAEAFTDGWFRSGDLARLDPDGYARITGRAKELIITGGYNVHPREVEEALLTHPGVRECAVAGVPSEEWGEEVWAWVVPRAGGSAGERALREHCRDRLAPYKVPKRIVSVGELPRNAMGKVQRHLLGR